MRNKGTSGPRVDTCEAQAFKVWEEKQVATNEPEKNKPKGLHQKSAAKNTKIMDYFKLEVRSRLSDSMKRN